jgi:hypothetical protein
MLVVLADCVGTEEAGAAPNRLSKESIAELQRIFPLTYHHSLVEKSRFRQAMDKLRKQLD